MHDRLVSQPAENGRELIMHVKHFSILFRCITAVESMVTEQTIDTKRIMKQFYLSILCLTFIAGGGISTAVQASDKADSTTNWRYVGKLDSIQNINEVVIDGTPVIPKYREVIPAQVLKDVDLQRLNSFSVADAIRLFCRRATQRLRRRRRSENRQHPLDGHQPVSYTHLKTGKP